MVPGGVEVADILADPNYGGGGGLRGEGSAKASSKPSGGRRKMATASKRVLLELWRKSRRALKQVCSQWEKLKCFIPPPHLVQHTLRVDLTQIW